MTPIILLSRWLPEPPVPAARIPFLRFPFGGSAMSPFRVPSSLLVLALLAAAPRAQHEGHEHKPAPAPQAPAAEAPSDAQVIAAQMPSYPLETCVVSGEPLAGGDMTPVDVVHDGRLVRLCCKGCLKDLKKDPASYLAKIDTAVVAAQKSTYPLTTCPLTGAPLGAGAIDVVHGTRLVRLGGEACRAKFAADPQAALAKVDAALIAAQLPDYPLATCVVTGEALGDAPVRHLHGTQLVQFCCKECVPKFQAAPEQYLKALKGAPATKPQPGHGDHGDSHDGHSGHGGHGCAGC